MLLLTRCGDDVWCSVFMELYERIANALQLLVKFVPYTLLSNFAKVETEMKLYGMVWLYLCVTMCVMCATMSSVCNYEYSVCNYVYSVGNCVHTVCITLSSMCNYVYNVCNYVCNVCM